MKLKEIRKSYEDLSGGASELSQKLAFAGIGLMWIFRISTGEQTTLPDGLLWFEPLLVLSLGIGVFQYLLQSAMWYIYYHCKRSKGYKEDDEVNEPEWANYPAWLLWLATICTMVWAYAILFLYLITK